MNTENEFVNWPRTPDGRLICSPERPMPVGNGNAYSHRWAHTNFKEVSGTKRDGYPAADILTMQCRDCGYTCDAELPD